jgi:hypothetical protein
MSTKGMRKLRVTMYEILDALESHGDGQTHYLNTETGEVEIWIDPSLSGAENPFDPDDEQYVAVPQQDSHDEYRIMENFVLGVDEEDVQDVLRLAISGKGAFRRFRESLAGYPDLRARWEREKRDRLVEEAIAWLAKLGIEPEYELPPLRLPEPPRRPEPRAGGAPRVGLFDMLLLGAPEGKTELIDGRVHRVYVAADRSQGRRVFAQLARELAERHGLSWRKRFIADTDRFSIERFELTQSDRVVDLSVEVPRTLWDAFAPGG